MGGAVKAAAGLIWRSRHCNLWARRCVDPGTGGPGQYLTQEKGSLLASRLPGLRRRDCRSMAASLPHPCRVASLPRADLQLRIEHSRGPATGVCRAGRPGAAQSSSTQWRPPRGWSCMPPLASCMRETPSR